MPDRRMRWNGYMAAEAPFPSGAALEYHIETGDRYFAGDHAQGLGRSLWVLEPTGRRHKLLDSAAYLNPKTTAANLQSADIRFRVIKVYDGEQGEHTETDLTAEYIQRSTKTRTMAVLLIGTSSIWLGILAAIFVHSAGYVIAIGLFGYAVLALLPMRSNTSKRSALVQAGSTIPSYAAGYSAAFLIVRHLVDR